MLYFITSNEEKINHARPFLTEHHIPFIVKDLPITEIQSDSSEEITKNKADQAHKILKAPLIITDHKWDIPGLKGFPGPYMKYMNQWFTPQNFLDLTKNLPDRRVFIEQVLCYQDQNTVKLFKQTHEGELLKVSRGPIYNYPAMTIISHLDGLSNAEAREQNLTFLDSSQMWSKFAEWYKKYIK